MRELSEIQNEGIALNANKEDNCTGQFYPLPSVALTLRATSNLLPINLWEGPFLSIKSNQKPH